MPEYFDYNATTPVDPEVADIVYHYMVEEFGNAGSRTHEFGTRAAKAVQTARKQVAEVLDTDPEDVIFTSGATESDNLAILGLEEVLREQGKKHVITSLAEHKAVLEPFKVLEKRGFEVTWLRPTIDGYVPAADLDAALREDTGLVSLMHVNNETGIIQPLEEYADVLADHPAYFHTDAAQGFGKDIERLQNKRIDLMSVSGHKIYAPKGIGALMVRYRDGEGRVPVRALMYGGGQERGVRPGTLPVALAVGLGKAASNALRDREERKDRALQVRDRLLSYLRYDDIVINGKMEKNIGSTLNFRVEGLDGEALILYLKDIASFSNGSACTSLDYNPSHVLTAMGMSTDEAEGAIRISWSHLSTKSMDEVEKLGKSLAEFLSRVTPQ